MDSNMDLDVETCIKFLKENGYRVSKKTESVHIATCACGYKGTEVWYGTGTVRRVCRHCGLSGEPPKTDRQAKINYNKAVDAKINELYGQMYAPLLH